MEPTFEQYIEGFGALLECPACGGNHLHHEMVDVFEREERNVGVRSFIITSSAL